MFTEWRKHPHIENSFYDSIYYNCYRLTSFFIVYYIVCFIKMLTNIVGLSLIILLQYSSALGLLLNWFNLDYYMQSNKIGLPNAFHCTKIIEYCSYFFNLFYIKNSCRSSLLILYQFWDNKTFFETGMCKQF